MGAMKTTVEIAVHGLPMFLHQVTVKFFDKLLRFSRI